MNIGGFGAAIMPATLKGRCAPNIGALNPGPTTVAIPFPGAQPGDCLIINPTPLLSDDIFIVQCHVSNLDELSVVFYNISGAPITPGVTPFNVALIRG